eukprot:766741-Hanusia_phi.AAC.2
MAAFENPRTLRQQERETSAGEEKRRRGERGERGKKAGRHDAGEGWQSDWRIEEKREKEGEWEKKVGVREGGSEKK